MTIGARLVFVGGLLVASLLTGCHAGPSQSPGGSAGAFGPVASGKIRRTLIEKRPVAAMPGWETRLYLIEYGPGAVAPLHVHPAVGVGLVLEGAFESAFGDEPLVQVRAGQGFVDPAGVAHRAFRNLSADGLLRFVIAYTIREHEEIFYPGAALPPSAP